MAYHPDKHHRRSTRLKGHNYASAGAYFITLCTYQRECLFGKIIDGQMQLSEFGQIAADEWMRSSTIRQEIELDQWIIMPNHIHGIVIIRSSAQPIYPVGANGRSPLPTVNLSLPSGSFIPSMRPKSLSSLVAGFKSATTKRINILRNEPGTPLWQRNYYDRIIRDRTALQHIRQYVQSNPLSWQQDQLHPANLSEW